MKAVVLAAGFGKRLKPLTDYLPKALMPILGVPAIDHVLKRLMLHNVRQAGVNVHYRAEQIVSHLNRHYTGTADTCTATATASKYYPGYLKKNIEIRIAQEEKILGTGGAVYNFRDFLRGEEPFWVYNGDIISDLDLPSALRFHRQKKPLATLILWDYPPINTVLLDRDGNIIDFFSKSEPAAGKDAASKEVEGKDPAGKEAAGKEVAGKDLVNKGLEGKDCGCRSLTFTGISILSPQILDYLPDGYSEMPQVYQNIIDCQGAGKICGFIGRGRYWMDFGTLSSYLDVHRDLLLGYPLDSQTHNTTHGTTNNTTHNMTETNNSTRNKITKYSAKYPAGYVYLSGTNITVSNRADLRGFVSVGNGCVIEDDVFLEDCVLWPATIVKSGTQAQRAVLSKDFICRVG